MRPDLSRIRHMFKLDPDRPISDDHLERICMSGTDAVVVGGSSGVTYDNTVELLFRIRRFPIPSFLEVSSREAIVPGFDLYFIPFVLNAGEVDWLIAEHCRAIREYGPILPWPQMIPEAYLILNPAAEAAKLTRAKADLEPEDIVAYVCLAERLLSFPVIYMEYSGKFGDMELLRQAKEQLSEARLFYGGGIDDPQKALAAAQVADTIIVGNAVYENLQGALSTVQAVKGR